ncbi:MAG TPA: VWA domain-containing protein [Pyrinomonadaceae bacterium]|nr:VWA domain-containing protein [Pyrinomonadaceae bacterium]
MNTKALFALLILLCIPAQGMAQSTDQDDVVRINTNLVQIDAVVTKGGKLVADLKVEDFEIFEDGKRQTITSFAYISNTPRTSEARDKSVPFAPLKRDDPRRTLAIVIDDLGMSATSVSDARRQLRKFVAEKLQPHDLVAIIRTSGQIGALQQFTNDKRVLNRAVEQLRWNICSRVGIDVLPPTQGTSPLSNYDGTCGGSSFFSTMGAMKAVLDALAELPGRKAMMVLSDSLPIEYQDSPLFTYASGPVSDSAVRRMALQRIAEKAIRSSVVIYSIDTQGLQPLGPTAADSFSGNLRMTGPTMNDMLATRSRLLFDRRAGGEMIARQTGGFQIRNSNDYKFQSILDEQSGYYLIGYRPTEETFNRKFHRITAKVKRSGMSLRTRYGFYGYSEEDDIKRPQPKTNLALMSPFGAQDITVDFTSFFANSKTTGSVIRSFLYLEAKELTFVKVNDKHEANIELHGVIFGDNGVVVEEFNHTGVISLPDKDYEQAVREGIRINFDMPARKPGAYQVRVAARDAASLSIGSAGQFVAVPDLKKKRLAASGIVLLSVAEVQTDTGEVTSASPAVRRFRPDSDLHFAFVVYNALLDRASGRPNLVVESKLFRDGKHVTSFPEATVDVSNQPDLERIFVNRMIRLGADLEPGYYYLQLVITDKAAGEKPPVTIQWVDFEITKRSE